MSGIKVVRKSRDLLINRLGNLCDVNVNKCFKNIKKVSKTTKSFYVLEMKSALKITILEWNNLKFYSKRGLKTVVIVIQELWTINYHKKNECLSYLLKESDRQTTLMIDWTDDDNLLTLLPLKQFIFIYICSCQTFLYTYQYVVQYLLFDLLLLTNIFIIINNIL